MDHDEGGLRIFESGALLQYCCECKCPPGSAAAARAAQLLPPPSEPRARGAVLSWLAWMTVGARLCDAWCSPQGPGAGLLRVGAVQAAVVGATAS